MLEKLDENLSANGTSSLCVPVTINKDGSLSRNSSAVSPEQFRLISNYVNQKMKEIGRRILAGELRLSLMRWENEMRVSIVLIKVPAGLMRKPRDTTTAD